jgi:tetratricopeptide (TPR) repeat protein
MTRWLAAVWLVGMASGVTAQQADPAARAFDLERRGLHPQAADLYRQILTTRPADLGALLGLERSLTPQAKVAEMVPELRKALGAGEPSSALYGIAVRVYTASGQPDSARAAVERWAALEPKSEAPYQEWGSAALGARDRPLAKLAYQTGRSRLGSEVLAGELAQLATIEADYPTAVREWIVAVGKIPGYRSAAVSMLGQVPVVGRSGVLRNLELAKSPIGERVAATLTIRWGDPVGGIRRIERAIPLLGDQTVEALQEGLDELRGQSGREVAMARGIGLELLGTRAPNQSTRFWLEAAQAYSDAGDQGSARRMLGKLASDSKVSPTMAASATSTLVSVLVSEGKMEEATKQFHQLKGILAAEERQQLEIRVAEGWVRAGQLERAEQMVAQDSTIEGLAIRGRIRLYLGDIKGAAELMRFAGPFAGAREAAVSRTAALALIQVIEEDSVPALGGALLKLERRDSAGAADDLEKLAAEFPPDKGRAELFLLAGRVRLGLADRPGAERLLRLAAELKVPASAAAAGLELARIMVDTDRKALAIEALETLLIAYPTSAVAPQARRLLDVAKGAIPPV